MPVLGRVLASDVSFLVMIELVCLMKLRVSGLWPYVIQYFGRGRPLAARVGGWQIRFLLFCCCCCCFSMSSASATIRVMDKRGMHTGRGNDDIVVLDLGLDLVSMSPLLTDDEDDGGGVGWEARGRRSGCNPSSSSCCCC